MDDNTGRVEMKDTGGDCSDDDLDSDDALLEMLGLSTFKEALVKVSDDENSNGNSNDMDIGPHRSPLPILSDDFIGSLVAPLRTEYLEESICTFPPEFSIPAVHMRRLTEELILGWEQRTSGSDV